MTNVEVSTELATKIYNLVESIKADGRLRKGANETTKSIERGEAKLVILAGDVNPPEVVMHLPILCGEKNIPFVQISSKAELGAAAGLPVGTAAVAIVMAGDSKRKLDAVLADLDALSDKKAKAKAEPVAAPAEEKAAPAKEKAAETPAAEAPAEEKPAEKKQAEEKPKKPKAGKADKKAEKAQKEKPAEEKAEAGSAEKPAE